MGREAVVCVLITAVLTVGCASNPHGHGGRFICEHEPGGCASKSTTPYRATYVLYHWRTPPEGEHPHTYVPDQEVTELYVRGLARWEKIGFVKEDDQLFAVAGKEKIPLPDGRYCWHITENTEYRGWQRVLHEAGENVMCVVTFPFALVAGVLSLPLFIGSLGVLGIGALFVLPFVWAFG